LELIDGGSGTGAGYSGDAGGFLVHFKPLLKNNSLFQIDIT
jgi:hypothetical protein